MSRNTRPPQHDSSDNSSSTAIEASDPNAAWDNASAWGSDWESSSNARSKAYGPGDLYRMVARRWKLVAICLAVSLVALALTSGMWLRQSFEADVVLLIERSPMRVIDVDELRVDSASARDFYNTQAEILESRSLAKQVSDELGLDMPLGAYRARLGVEIQRNSRLVRVSFRSPDPELAAAVANRHADAFIRRGMGMRDQASIKATAFLDASLTDLKQRLEDSEAALNEYRQATGIVSLQEGEVLLLDRINDLGRRIADVRGERISQQALLDLAELDQNTPLGEGDEMRAVLELRQTLRELEAEAASQGKLPNSSLRARIARTRRHLNEELERQVESARANQVATIELEEKLGAELDIAKREALALKDASVAYAILKREVETNRELYASVLARRKEIGMSTRLEATNVFIVDQAVPPARAAGLSRSLRVATLGGGALLFSLLIALGAGLLEDTIDPDEIDQALGLPCLGIVPAMGSKVSGRVQLPSRTTGETGKAVQKGGLDSMVRESYRAIRTCLLLSRPDEPPRTLLVTSSTHSEGKSTTALNLAASLAQPDAPVLIIDSDLRRPRCHRMLGLEPGPGLAEVLAGQVDPRAVIQRATPSLHLLPGSAETPPDPVALLGSDRMVELLESLARSYAFIIIDTPPLMPVSDAIALAPAVDGVVFVVGAKTPRSTAIKARSRLAVAHSHVLGAVLNGFDLRAVDASYNSKYYEA